MKCPQCNGELKQIITYKRDWDMTSYKVLTYICPACNHKNEQKVAVSSEEYDKMSKIRRFD